MTVEQLEELRNIRTELSMTGFPSDATEMLDAAVETLEKLPVTADGVLVVPGMTVWFWNGFPDCRIRESETVYRIFECEHPGEWLINDGEPPHFFYSTQAAAEAAMKEQQP